MKINTRDEFLLERWRRRLPNASAELMEEYARPLYGFLLAALGGVEKAAEEHFERVFAAMVESDALKTMQSPMLLQLLRCAIKEIRLSAKRSYEDPVLRRFSPDEDVQVRLLLCLKILSGMKLEDRVLILLRDLVELDTEEIAFVTFIPEGQLKNKLTAARIRFRESMNESLLSKKFHDLRKN